MYLDEKMGCVGSLKQFNVVRDIDITVHLKLAARNLKNRDTTLNLSVS